MQPTFSVELKTDPDGALRLALAGELDMPGAPALGLELGQALGAAQGTVTLDLTATTRMDGAAAAVLYGLRARLAQRGHGLTIVGARPEVERILQLYDDRDAQSPLRDSRPRVTAIEHVGQVSWALGSDIKGQLAFIGQVAASCLAGLRRPASIQWADMGRLMERTGADALPIVALIAFLIGLVTAFQAADALARYGANVFIADMVGLSMTRVMGPLMMGILVAGRSGAGIAAELGTMTVSEEIDALRVLGLDPIRFLVIPRILALVCMVPLLTLLADLVGIIGGGLIGVALLDLTPVAFANRLHAALDVWDVGTGLILSVAYGVAIGMVACERGLATRGGAEGVGRFTTSAVVAILFFLVVITAVLTILFQAWGI